MIGDINQSDTYYLVPYDDWNNFCEFFNYCIIRGSILTKKKHYIRNKLNRAPEKLSEMLSQYNDWILCDVKDSLYHMLGEDGDYNLKFISKCGKYEAVYNLQGDLLTEKNNPTNMGTYNYANYQKDVVAHFTWDVVPYGSYGNVPGTKGEKYVDRKSFDSNKKAQMYRKDIENLLNMEASINEKQERYKNIRSKYIK